MRCLEERKTINESDDNFVLFSRTSKQYPISRHLPPAFVKNNLLYLTSYGKINAVFPYYYEMREYDSYLMIYTIAGSGKLTVIDTSVLLTENTILFFTAINPIQSAFMIQKDGNMRYLT